MISKLFSFVFVVCILLLIGSIIRSGIKAYSAEERLSEMQKRVDVLGVKNQELLSEMGEYKTQEFAEKQIRNKLKLVQPGEKLVILPRELKEVEDSISHQYFEDDSTAKISLKPWEEWQKVFF